MKQRLPIEAVAELMQNFLIPIAQQGIAGAVDAHYAADGRGANAKSFGANCWTFLEEPYKRAVREKRIPFELADAQGCILYAPGWLVHHYRVGSYAYEDIRNAFPRDGKFKLEIEAEGQHVLPFAEKRPDVNNAAPAIFAFLANPKEGLVAAYCCEIAEMEGGKVRSWGKTIQLAVDPGQYASVTTGSESREPVTVRTPDVVLEPKETESAKRLSDNK